MSRISLIPTDVTFSGSTRPKIECELHLPGDLVNKEVSLVVYDRNLYARSEAAAFERSCVSPKDRGKMLPGFMVDDFQLPPGSTIPGNTGTWVNPDVTVGTGVLLTVQGTLRKAANTSGAPPRRQAQPRILLVRSCAARSASSRAFDHSHLGLV